MSGVSGACRYKIGSAVDGLPAGDLGLGRFCMAVDGLARYELADS